MIVLVTGGNGFIGRTACSSLPGVQVRASIRMEERRRELPEGVDSVVTGDVDPDTDWADALRNVDTVLHLAARVHVLPEVASDPLTAFRRANVDGTVRLAKAAADRGVRRLVFLSSVSVHGRRSGRIPFHEATPPRPETAYAISKWEAEMALAEVARVSGLEIVVVRAPMVYGPGAPGNFSRLVGLVARGVPLPLGSVSNQRSFIYHDNLVDVLRTCLDHPAAAGETFLVRDGTDVSTPEFVRMIARGLDRPARLAPCPPALLRLGGRITGRLREIESLVDSLTVDDRKVRRVLEWEPPFSLEEAVEASVVAHPWS